MITHTHFYKQLSVFISTDLRWEKHTGYIISKAVSRFNFLKQLKRAGLSTPHSLHFWAYIHSDQTSTRICLTALAPYFDQVSNGTFGSCLTKGN